MSTAVRTGVILLANKKQPKVSVAKEHSWMHNREFDSSGALVRSTPLIVWTTPMWYAEDILEAHKADAEFSHPNPLVHNTIMLYSVAI